MYPHRCMYNECIMYIVRTATTTHRSTYYTEWNLLIIWIEMCMYLIKRSRLRCIHQNVPVWMWINVIMACIHSPFEWSLFHHWDSTIQLHWILLDLNGRCLHLSVYTHTPSYVLVRLRLMLMSIRIWIGGCVGCFTEIALFCTSD